MRAPVLLVGSVPFATAEDVFRETSRAIGDLVDRLPDGEVGARINFILWQAPLFERLPGLEVQDHRSAFPGQPPRPLYGPKHGATAESLRFPPLGYARDAIASYRTFGKLRADGDIKPGMRFQICLPSPMSVAFHWSAPKALRSVWALYEERMASELDEIAAHVPHEDLSVQWDVCAEICWLMEKPEYVGLVPGDELLDGVARVADRVPPEAHLGFHLCYGDLNHKHTVEPRDTGILTWTANGIAARVKRTIQYVHMPVPRDRTDDAYFAPLAGLEMKPETLLYLGLVHETDGIEGAKRRLTAARKVVGNFGVATECGFGRRPPERIPALLALHRQVAVELGG